jgi:hypothetical protein
MNTPDPAQAHTLVSERVQPDGPLSGAVKRGGAHYTYLITHGGQAVKIGHSHNPKKRIADMQVGSPVHMRVFHAWRLTKERAVYLERRLHALFKAQHSHGEWYSAPAADVRSVGDVVLSGREEHADRIVWLLAAAAQNERKQVFVQNFWPDKPHRATWQQKKARQREVQALLPDLRREFAAIMVEAMDLGLRPRLDDLHWDKLGGALSRYRALAEGREWAPKPVYFGRRAEPYPDNEPTYKANEDLYSSGDADLDDDMSEWRMAIYDA